MLFFNNSFHCFIFFSLFCNIVFFQNILVLKLFFLIFFYFFNLSTNIFFSLYYYFLLQYFFSFSILIAYMFSFFPFFFSLPSKTYIFHYDNAGPPYISVNEEPYVLWTRDRDPGLEKTPN